MERLDNLFFVLVRPVYLGNIGSTARVLKNFGIRGLRFVQPPKGYRDSEARRMSVGAFDVLKESAVFETLDDALKDINVAIGTTSGQQRDMEITELQEVSPRLRHALSSNKIAIVIGDERNGLLRAELERCHQVVTIPTNPEFPALNMAQAAGIFAYEFSRPQAEQTGADVYTSGKQDDELFAHLDQLLEAVEFTRSFNRKNVLSELRRFYQRAYPTARELDLLNGAIRKINQKIED